MIIQVSDLVKKYKNVTAVDGLSFRVEEGKIFGLLGPNGAGKSTTINTMLGLVKPDEGKVEIMGHDMSLSPRDVKANIGYVPQDFAFYEDMSAYANVKYWAKLYNLKGSKVETSVKEALEQTGLWERKNDKAKEFSGGMKRRLNIACGIVHKPKILFMDEPTAGVDPQSRNHIRETVLALNKSGTTILYTSHYMEEIEEICDRVIIVDFGKIIASGTVAELIASIPNDKKITIEVKDLTDEIVNVFSRSDGVEQCSREGNKVHITMEQDDVYFSKLISNLVSANAQILSLDFEKINLETVFLRLTGKKLRD